MAQKVERDPDAVALASAYNDSDFEDRKDDEYCAVHAFLPGAGVFYCHRERRKPETGFENSFVPLDMSWLQLTWETSELATGANCFPDVLAVMQDIEGDTGLQPVACMVDKGSEDRVAYSIDMSVDLGNASHYDVGDVSQGFSVWTEEVPGLAANWFFEMPNVCGMNNGTPFNGVAIKLYHG